MDLDAFETIPDDVASLPPPPPPPNTPVKKRARKPRVAKQWQEEEEEPDDEETKRRRDVLAQAVILEDLSNVSVKAVRTMRKKDLDVLFEDYNLQLSKEVALKLLETGTTLFVSLLDRFVGLKDADELKSDLLESKTLKRTIGMRCSEITEKYGDVVGWIKIASDVFKQTSKRDEDTQLKDSSEPRKDGE